MIVRIKNYSILILALLISCNDFDKDEASRIIAFEPFYFLKLHSVFDVYLLQDTSFSIKVAGEEGLIKHVRFEIEGDVVSVHNEFKGKWLNPETNKVKLYISASFLYKIELYESCNIQTIDPIVSPDFVIFNHATPKLCQVDVELANSTFLYWNNYQCGGKVILRGRTGYLEAHTFALMTMDASQLITDDAFIENSSKGDCQVNVVRQLKYSIHNTGNIYLHRTPAEIILNERTSTGQLIRLN
jgi:hypothetical protein